MADDLLLTLNNVQFEWMNILNKFSSTFCSVHVFVSLSSTWQMDNINTRTRRREARTLPSSIRLYFLFAFCEKSKFMSVRLSSRMNAFSMQKNIVFFLFPRIANIVEEQNKQTNVQKTVYEVENERRICLFFTTKLSRLRRRIKNTEKIKTECSWTKRKETPTIGSVFFLLDRKEWMIACQTAIFIRNHRIGMNPNAIELNKFFIAFFSCSLETNFIFKWKKKQQKTLSGRTHQLNLILILFHAQQNRFCDLTLTLFPRQRFALCLPLLTVWDYSCDIYRWHGNKWLLSVYISTQFFFCLPLLYLSERFFFIIEKQIEYLAKNTYAHKQTKWERITIKYWP